MNLSECLDKLRDTPEDYETLWLQFGGAIVGAKEWRQKAGSIPLQRILTVTDEAFLLLVLDNCQDRWDAMLDRHAQGLTMVSAACSAC